MQESNFYSDDFEELIREKTEQYKMYPSENVWKGVHNSLHTKRRWFIGGMSFLVTGILFLAGRELILSSVHPALTVKTVMAGQVGADLAKTTVGLSASPTTLAAYRPPASTSSPHHSGNTVSNSEYGAEEPGLSYTGMTGMTITTSHL